MAYSLVGVDGNAFAIIGFTARVLKEQGLKTLVPEMQARATSGDYNNVITTCLEYVEKANVAARAGEDDFYDGDDGEENE